MSETHNTWLTDKYWVKREAIVRKWSISDEIFESIAREVLKAK